MRLMFTNTGRKTHVVREGAYHGRDGTILSGLCGARIDGPPWEADELTPDAECKTCTKLYREGAR